jgi:hypothetical protein
MTQGEFSVKAQFPLTAVAAFLFATVSQATFAVEVSGCVDRDPISGEQVCTLVEGETPSPVVVTSLYDEDLQEGYWTIFDQGPGSVVRNYVVFNNNEDDNSGDDDTPPTISLYSAAFPPGLLTGLLELGTLRRNGNSVLTFDQLDDSGDFNDTYRIVLAQSTPVPAPETYALLLSGLAAFALMRRQSSLPMS